MVFSLLRAVMDTFFKITFGILLGIVGCFTWDFYQAQQAAFKGLRPGWVALDPSVRGHRSVVAQVEKPAPAIPPVRMPAPAAPKPTPVQAQPVRRNTTQQAELSLLANEKYRWPRTVRINSKFEVPLMSDGKQVGQIPLEPGMEIELLQVLGDGRLVARIGKLSFHVSANITDVLQKALPKGTPPPPHPRPIVSKPQQPASKPNQADNPEQPPPSGGTPTLFGTRYD